MDILLRIAGTLIVLVVVQDVFFTVLFPASSGRGFLRPLLKKGTWHAFRLIGKMTSGQRRRNVLSYGGPAQIINTLAAWFLLLLLGWAMIYKPALGTSIGASSGPTDTGWATALYYSGYAMTTLGFGDVVPKTGLYRLLTILQTAVGFTVLSMVISYFLSVYSSLLPRNAFAQGLHHLTGGTDDAAQLLARLSEGDDLSAARSHLSTKADFLRQTYQSHHFYPVLRYFHYREPFYALPRILLTALDTATLLRSALDEEHHDRVIHSPEQDELFEAALALMHELAPGVEGEAPTQVQAAEWRDRYDAATDRLAETGLHVRDDLEAGADEYVARRAAWNQPVRCLAEAMLYDWEAIEDAGERAPIRA